MRKVLITSIILISVCTLTYFFYAQNINKSNSIKTDSNPVEYIPTSNTIKEDIPTPTPISKTVTYKEIPAKANAKYFEKVVKVGSELVYLAYPLTVEKDNPPRVIIYSHGSNTTVSRDFTDPFMKDMQMYGEFFTKSGYAFSASSLHGANWGNDQSVKDISDQLKYINSKYMVKKEINLLGFSMGGLTVFNYSFANPKNINSIALLAPTSRTYSQQQFNLIKNTPVQIWHGDKDVNVPLSLSTSLLSRANSFGLKDIGLKIIEDKGHFEIDTELKKEILEQYNKYE